MTQYRNAACLLMALALGSTACRSTKEDPPAPPAPLAPPPVVTPPPVPEATAAPQKPTFGQTPPEGIVANQWVVGGQCNIDFVNGPVKFNKPTPVTAGASVRVLGWAYDDKPVKLPEVVAVRFASKEGEYYGPVTKGTKRDDVAIARHNPSLTDSGFELTFDSSLLPPGAYALTTVMRSGDKTYICDNGYKISVTP